MGISYDSQETTITIKVKGIFEEEDEIFERVLKRKSKLNLDFFSIFDNSIASKGEVLGNLGLRRTAIHGLSDIKLEDLPNFDFESYKERAKLEGVYRELKDGERQNVDLKNSIGEYLYLIDKSGNGLRLNAERGRDPVRLIGNENPRVMIVEGDLIIEGRHGLHLDNIYFCS